MMDKLESEFLFSNTYRDKEGKEQKASVKLRVNYSMETFDIEPYPGYSEQGFVFKNNSHKWRMWLAVTESIQEAIRYATVDLGFDIAEVDWDNLMNVSTT